MSEYNFQEIEKKWQKKWNADNTFKTAIEPSKPKYYVLDMFPYPSGAGLHVGHPLGYIASDIMARYKRTKGYNVLHPMGFDSFGLPAEQYAMQTGQHPAITTEVNINRYKEQLDKIGFSYDWSKEIRTSSPDYYQWTQWIFIQLFDSWYNKKSNKAEPIKSLITKFENEGNIELDACCDEDVELFTAEEWKDKTKIKQEKILLQYRLTYLAELMVNWCPALGTVLANEEVKDGLSERGGHPVIRKKMKQWVMRITAYAERLLEGLNHIDWPEPMKEMQKNWIGKSYGAELSFKVVKDNLPTDAPDELTVFTTRVDTTFGVTYISIAPEHEWLPNLTAPSHKEEVEKYIVLAQNKSERDRMTDVKTVSGQFTGTYVVNPFTNQNIPLYIADYVLAGYGTGIVMAVPSSDERDYRFAQHFNLPIITVQEGEHTDISKEGFDPKAGTMINSGFLNGLYVQDAIQEAIKFVEKNNIGKGKINYKMRDAIFSRQRYWGEPIPIRFENEIPIPLSTSELPLLLPEIDKYQPTENGEPPLGRSKEFAEKNYELNTMPGWAGSSWYFLRYMDANNKEQLVSNEAQKYWNQVDLYIGGSEHATGHLLYSRFWNLFLYDLNYIDHAEPFKKLINQGMIQGRSSFVYRINGQNKFVSYNLKKDYDVQAIHVDISLVNHDILDLEAFKNWRADFNNAEFILEDGKYHCGYEIEKMSKSKYNVVNPDDIVEKYGADTLRMYEMFLGPLEQFKPWNTHGIDGVFRFIRKLWRLVYDEQGKLILNNEEPSKEALKILHKTIKKIEDDIEKFSFNTSVSSFMICVNTLQELKCHNRQIIHDLVITLSPFAPFITEEIWHSAFGYNTSISHANFPVYNESYIIENEFEYPISINGKVRSKIKLPLELSKEEIEKIISNSDTLDKWLEGKTPKKIIVVHGKIVNLVL